MRWTPVLSKEKKSGLKKGVVEEPMATPTKTTATKVEKVDGPADAPASVKGKGVKKESVEDYPPGTISLGVA